jgi:sulfonate transport system permease protein
MVRRSQALISDLPGGAPVLVGASPGDLEVAAGVLSPTAGEQRPNRHLTASLLTLREASAPADFVERERRWTFKFLDRQLLLNIVLGLSFPLALLIAWQLSSSYEWLPDQILPAPAAVRQVLQDHFDDGSLWDDTAISLLRVVRGFAVGAAIGLGLGGLLASSRRLYDYLDPLFLAVIQVPTLGWVPLLIIVIGIDEGLKTILVALSVFIPVTLGTYQGIRDVPSAYREVGRVFTFNRRETIATIVLPAAVPAIFTGLREGLANGWQTLVAVEILASTEGLGYQMAYGRQLFQLELVIAAMLLIGTIGYLSDALLGRIERHLQRWKVAS